MEALTKAINSISADWNWIICNLTSVVTAGIYACEACENQPKSLEHRIQRIQKKKASAIEAFLSGDLTREELQDIKAQYNEKLALLHAKLETCNKTKKSVQTQNQKEIEERIRSIVTCRNAAEPYCKALLEKMVIQKEGNLQIKMNHIPQIWHFKIQYHGFDESESSGT